MRRPLLVLVLVLTLAAAHAASSSGEVWRSPRGSGHASKVRKRVRGVIAYARRQVGVPYRYDGSSRSVGFDCSGLVYASYRSIGKTIPRSSWDQLRVGRPIHFAALRPGDLLFTEGGGHVQLVVSKRAAISAPETGERVRYVALTRLREPLAGAR